jgi:hypothetical protein
MSITYHSDANEKPDGNSFFSPMNSVTIIGNFHDIFTRDALGNLKSVGERGRVNPVSVIEDIKQRQTVNRVIANAKLAFNPVKTSDCRLYHGCGQHDSEWYDTFILLLRTM